MHISLIYPIPTLKPIIIIKNTTHNRILSSAFNNFLKHLITIKWKRYMPKLCFPMNPIIPERFFEYILIKRNKHPNNIPAINVLDKTLLSHNHQFNWWFTLGPDKGRSLLPPKGGMLQACYWSTTKWYYSLLSSIRHSALQCTFLSQIL